MSHFLLLPSSCVRSITKPDVARIHVRNVDTETTKRMADGDHVGPAVFELFSFFRLPFSEDLRRVIRRLIEPCSAKVEHEWRLDHRDLDEQEAIIETQKLGNVVSAHLSNFKFVQPQVRVPFPYVGVSRSKTFNADEPVRDWPTASSTLPCTSWPYLRPVSVRDCRRAYSTARCSNSL